MNQTACRPPILICFAVKEERAAFQPRHSTTQTRLTGMGPRQARKAIEDFLNQATPGCVLTCGFAGGLNPDLASGDVLYHKESDPSLSLVLQEEGARPAILHSTDTVAITAEDKARLWSDTGADAVEMESGVIMDMCQARQIPCAAVRVISDPAGQDLPLDFNQLMTSDDTLSMGRLFLAVLRSPGSIPGLMRLQRQTREAARKLAGVLQHVEDAISTK